MAEDFDQWNKIKKKIETEKQVPDFHIREIWFCTLGRNVGIEENGKHENFERPVLIIQKFNKKMLLIAPLTSSHRDLPFYHLLDYASVSSVMLSQIKIIDARRLLRKIRTIPSQEFALIKEKIRRII